MNLADVRSRFLAFYKERGHVIVPSAPIVPLNDPTTLFTGSGMQPMVPYLLGEPHPLGTRIADSQKCFRAEDIDEVGDNRHTTFFEMLGNWSLGDYFKEDQLRWIFTFLTEDIGLDPTRLYVTAFIGDTEHNLPKDTEAAALWKTLFAEKGIAAEAIDIGSEADGYQKGMQGGRIFYYEAKKNWWSRAGTPANMPAGEPGGPDSEIFYDFGTPHDPRFGPECHPNCDCGRFFEIANSVFMQYLKLEDGSFGALPNKNVDFGGGLERIAAAAQHNPDVFTTDVFKSVIATLSDLSQKQYEDEQYKRSFRIVADHMRAAVFMLSDGVRPSNTDRGYILRRVLRRAAQHAQKLGIAHGTAETSPLILTASIIIENYKSAYTELAEDSMYRAIRDEIWNEELQFARALDAGMKEFERIATSDITGEQAYTLFTTYGFPFEMTKEIAAERGLAVDEAAFKELMRAHQELSRAGAEQKFKGGLADSSLETTRLHTTHHILLKALQRVLGPEVKQRGSNITQERLRIDFSWGQKMTAEQIKEVESLVNATIAQNLPVTRSTLPKSEAELLGAEHEFGAKYPDIVSVYSVGPAGADVDNPMFDRAFSIEFCGGPHVQNTSDIQEGGVFKILKEEAVAAGIRRIKASLIPR